MKNKEKINKALNFTKYQTYNDINKNNKEVVEVSIEDLTNLPPEEKKEYKYLMTRNKSKVKGPSDHELLLLIYDKVVKLETKVDKLEQFQINQLKFNEHQTEFNKYVIKRLDEQKEFNQEQKEFNQEQKEFNEFVVEQFKQHGWIK